MSGNIQDTNVNQIKEQVHQLQQEIQTIYSQGDNPADREDALARKYKQLSTTSNSLFKFIVANYGTTRFDQIFFDQTLDMMLSKIAEIQQSKTSQHDASQNIGQHLASSFIPQLKK
jgi:hypothetical protein